VLGAQSLGLVLVARHGRYAQPPQACRELRTPRKTMPRWLRLAGRSAVLSPRSPRNLSVLPVTVTCEGPGEAELPGLGRPGGSRLT